MWNSLIWPLKKLNFTLKKNIRQDVTLEKSKINLISLYMRIVHQILKIKMKWILKTKDNKDQAHL